jgi:DNA-binding NarL/FixJ family response regulator
MSGCTPSELAILDRHDAGASVAEIAAELGLRTATVRKIVERYNDGLEGDRRWRAAAETACRGHLKAIRASGGSFL